MKPLHSSSPGPVPLPDQFLCLNLFPISSVTKLVEESKVLHIEKAIKAASIDLDRQDWFKLLEASRGEPVP